MSEDETTADAPHYDPDQLLRNLDKWKSEEGDRASDAGEMRQQIGQFIEDTGLNKKALSMVRALDKMKPNKREDTLRSLDMLLDDMKPHWSGQSTADMFDNSPDGAVEPYEPEAA